MTGNSVLLHRGHIGGGRQGIGRAAFMEWYPRDRVTFRDPSRADEEEVAILVAYLESSRFLIQPESFVDAVLRFKASRRTDEPTRMSDNDLRQKAAAARPKPKSATTVVVAYERNRHVAELASEGQGANANCAESRRPSPMHRTSPTWSPTTSSGSLTAVSTVLRTLSLCPNCHRKMHVVNDLKDVRKLQRRAGPALRG